MRLSVVLYCFNLIVNFFVVGFLGEGEGITGTWTQIHHGDYVLPGQSNIETSVDGVFYTDHVRWILREQSHFFLLNTLCRPD